MNFRDEKFVRFQDLGSEQSFNSERTYSDEKPLLGRFGRTLSSVSSSIQRSYRWGYGGIRKLQKSFQLRSPSDLSTERSESSKKVFDPQGKFIQRWNKVFVLSCVLAIYLDPLFFYIPVMNENCLDVDRKLEITACVLRSFTDIFYVLHIFFKFRTGFIAPSSWVFGRGVLVEDLQAVASRYLSSYFFIDVLAVLPLPQVPMFKNMDDQLLDAMCDRLKPSLHTEDSYIVREGDPVDEMLFVMRGKLESVTTNGGRTGFFNSDFLKEGDFCGEELLTWALDPNPSASLPSSTRTVRALSEVEAFALTSDDLRFVAKQFRQLALSRLHGADTARRGLRSHCTGRKTSCRQHLLRMEVVAIHQALELPFMLPGLLPMHSVHSVQHARLSCWPGLHSSSFQSQLNPTLQLMMTSTTAAGQLVRSWSVQHVVLPSTFSFCTWAEVIKLFINTFAENMAACKWMLLCFAPVL